MDIFQSVIYFSILVIVLLYPKARLTARVYRAVKERRLTFYDNFMCAVPLWNSYMIKKLFYGAAPVIKIVNNVVVVNMILMVLIRTVFYNNILLQLVATILVLISFIAIIVVDIHIGYDLCQLLQRDKGLKTICILFPPLGHYLLSNYILVYFNEKKDIIRGTFDGEANTEQA